MSISTTPELLGLEIAVLQQEAKKAFDEKDLNMYLILVNQIILDETLLFAPQISLSH